ncbi:TetR/AcrR family transcriptional regulator [Staphylococcus croceilyticus]|uniref:TetR/AcrR family transcriptional regulator n=1 Tax=Staphylococcus croceilyticus TaxID=319942 RepID=A0ABY2KF12_9STAP|nr:TetR family transcriptional regulator [Staphylococcus croceilyticus]PNZ70093.1 TetR/AcrR family transcriptional regulator [Staphylococcus croceilyticus]TGA80510.1 TetR/AcrR family transcriptional regulator [Staphylococcus croceilyticus]
MSYSRKTQLTQRLLKEALIKLLQHKNFEEVTINEIAEEAYVTRSTFYRYYEDKYELLSDIEDEILNYIKTQREFDVSQFDEMNIFKTKSIVNLFKSLDPYSDVLKVLLTNPGIISFRMKIRKVVSHRLDFLNQIGSGSKVRIDLGKEYLVAIIINTFEYWSLHKDDVDEREIAQLITEVHHKGIVHALGINIDDIRKLT